MCLGKNIKTMARQICWHVPGEKYYRELGLIIINVYNAARKWHGSRKQWQFSAEHKAIVRDLLGD